MIRILTLVGLILISCKLTNEPSRPETYYSIARIDSINSYYLIYAIRNDLTYKVVSKKEDLNDCAPIVVGSKYKLNLRSSLYTGKTKRGVITKSTYDLVSCIGYDSITTICYESNCVRGLFRTDNLMGLCFLQK